MNSIANKILLVLISLTCLSIFLLPFASVFDPSDQGEWVYLYLPEDWFSLLFYLPFVVLWIIYLVWKRIRNFLIFKILLVATAFVSFAVSFLSVGILAQDYVPGWGVFLSLLLFPMLVVFLVNQGILDRAKRKAATPVEN